MKKTALILLVLIGCVSYLYFNGNLIPLEDSVVDQEYVKKEILREAMQERMQDMLRMRESLLNGQRPDSIPLTRFAGLPNSEFIADSVVASHQDFFKTFDAMYGSVYEARDPKQQFNVIVQTCASCHTQTCPGPLRSIKKLEI
jgi:cytochrome c553